MKKRMAVLFVILFVSYGFPAFAQVNISNISIKFGTVSTFQSDWNNNSNHNWTFYPELEAGGNFFSPVVNWGLSFGHWDDGLQNINPIMDQETVTYEAYVLGLRFSATPENFLFNSKTFFFSILAGMNCSFSNRKNLSFPSLPEVKENIIQPYLGIQLNYSILPDVYVLGEIGSNLGINKTHLGRPVFLGGAKYNF